MSRVVLLRFGGAALSGLLGAALMILLLGRATPEATIEGTVAGTRADATMVVLASRNACAQPGRRPLALAWTEVPAGDFRLSRFAEGAPLTSPHPYVGAGQMR